MPNCRTCQTSFVSRQQDLNFYEKLGVPEPTQCPSCRHQERLAFRNERYLYKVNCALTNQTTISTYHPQTPVTVYQTTEWWTDKWDGLNYGQDFDFGQTFFRQFQKLRLQVPRQAMVTSQCENSDYSPYSVWCKNCYLCTSLVSSQDCLYSYQTISSRDCIDCALSYQCELCYESIYGFNLFNCHYTVNCRNSSDLLYCRDCQNCSNCIGSTNLRNQSFHIFNQPVSEIEYKQFKQQLQIRTLFNQFKQKVLNLSQQEPTRALHNINCENVVGDRLINCKDSYHCFEAENLENCAYLYNIPSGCTDCQDIQYSPKSTLTYNAISAVRNYNCRIISHAWDLTNSDYSEECYYSNNLFGCVGLKNKQFCIFNKQYSETEYHELKNRIILHMQKTQEWGEFFPREYSFFPYNQTVAQQFHPLTAAQAEENNLTWQPEQAKSPPIKETPELKNCQQCQKAFRLIKNELLFYQKQNLPTPNTCPNCRFARRTINRSTHQLEKASCQTCQTELQTSNANKQNLLCESCYLAKVY